VSPSRRSGIPSAVDGADRFQRDSSMTGRRKGRVIAALGAMVVVAGLVLILLGSDSHSPRAVSPARAASPAYICSHPVVQQGSITTRGAQILVVGTFRPEINYDAAMRFTRGQLGPQVDGCFSSSVVDSADGLQTLSVLGSPRQKALYEDYIQSYLRHSGKFSTVMSGEGEWPS
jgi:hypothetical protein